MTIINQSPDNPAPAPNPLIPQSGTLTPEEQAVVDANNALIQVYADREKPADSTTPPVADEPQQVGEGGQEVVGDPSASAPPPADFTPDPVTDTTNTTNTTDTTDTPVVDYSQYTPENFINRVQSNFSPEEAQAIIGLVQFQQNLDQRAVEQIDAITSGTHVAVPIELANRILNPQSPPTPPPGPSISPAPASMPGGYTGYTQQPAPVLPPGIDPDDLDPNVLAYLTQQAQANATLQSQIAEIQSTIQFQQQQSREEQNLTAINQGTEAFQAQYELTQTDIDNLSRQLVHSGMWQPLLARVNGDYARAAQLGLEQMYFMDPNYRERELRRGSLGDDDPQSIARRRNATALAGSAGTVTPISPVPSTTAPPSPTPQQQLKRGRSRTEAMAAEIVADRSNNTNYG